MIQSPRRTTRVAPLVVLVALIAYLAIVLSFVSAPAPARAAAIGDTANNQPWTTPSMPDKCSTDRIESGDVAGCLITSWGGFGEKGWGEPPFPDGSSAWKWIGWAYNGSPALVDWEAAMTKNQTAIGRVRVDQLRAPKPAHVLFSGFLTEIQDAGYRINDAIAYNFRCTSNSRKDCQGLTAASLSYHAFGLAVDINVSANPELTYRPDSTKGQRTACEVPMTTSIPQWVVQTAEKWGLLWGGYGWSGGCASPDASKASILRDPMHFEFRGSVDDAVAIAAHHGIYLAQDCDDDVCVWIEDDEPSSNDANDRDSSDDEDRPRVNRLGVDVERVFGATRYESSAATAGRWASATTVFVATGQNFPDSLAAGPAAARLDVPVLLVTRDSVPDATRAELQRLRPKSVVIVGGENAIGSTVARDLKKITGVTPSRVSGENRYETAELLTMAAWYGASADTLWMASGADFQDPLIASAAAALYDEPFMLVDLEDGLTDEQVTYIQGLGIERINVVVAPGELSRSVRRSLEAIADVDVFDHDDVAERSAAVWGEKRSSSKVALATSQNFPDALSAVPYAGQGRGTPIMLVPGSCVPESTIDEIARLDAETVTLFGGPAALGEAVEFLEEC